MLASSVSHKQKKIISNSTFTYKTEMPEMKINLNNVLKKSTTEYEMKEIKNSPQKGNRNMHVKHQDVLTIMKLLDPKVVELRKTHRLMRRLYCA